MAKRKIAFSEFKAVLAAAGEEHRFSKYALKKIYEAMDNTDKCMLEADCICKTWREETIKQLLPCTNIEQNYSAEVWRDIVKDKKSVAMLICEHINITAEAYLMPDNKILYRGW